MAEPQVVPELPDSSYKFDWLYLIFMIIFHGALFLIPWTFQWSYFFATIALQATLGGLGICVGFHRLLTHKSFETYKPVEYFLATLGTLSLQGGPIRWVATHRKHHQKADQEGDPHTPNRSFLWSHMLWIFMNPDEKYLVDLKNKYAKDLQKQPYYRFLEKYNFSLQLAFAALCFAIGGWKFVIWGLCIRLVFTYHSTWFVNSAAHTFGYQNFETQDRSTNCWWVAFLTYGEGWHNNHHAMPSSARHGLRLFELDLSYMTIWGMKLVGLAKNVKVPTKESLIHLKAALKKKRDLMDPSLMSLMIKRKVNSSK